MRDQQRSVDYLDFWLDVVQHMSLCRHFVREMRRSILVDTPQQLAEKEKSGSHSKRSSAILDQFGTLEDSAHTGDETMEKAKDQHISAFLRSENNGHSPSSSMDSTGNEHNGIGGTDSDSTHRSRPHTSGNNGRPSGVSGNGAARPSFMGSALHETSGSSPGTHTVQRSDLRQSAEKILYTYLLQGSEREIILPQGILQDIIVSIEDEHRDDPEVFDAAKDYVFQAMERDAFPGFLRSKALGNLVPPSTFARGILGLVAMFGGFWAAFILIFRNEPRHIRCWVRPEIAFLADDMLTFASSSCHSQSASTHSHHNNTSSTLSSPFLATANTPS